MDQIKDTLSYEQLIERAMNSVQLKNQMHSDTWKIDQADWSVDQDDGIIVFESPEQLLVTAPVQIIGTYDQREGSWMWSWANSSITPNLTHDAKSVLAYGERKNIAQLQESKSLISEYQAWELTALACELNEQQGVYRGSAGTTLIYMTFGAISLKQKE